VRYLILSDMHGNWEAFEAVLAHAGVESFDLALVLGDLVGYGASPNEVVDAVRALPRQVTIRGNHDKVVAGLDSGASFNHAALEAARWTTASLKAENLRHVTELPPGPTVVAPDLAICHGSPLDEDAYVFSEYDAHEIFLRHQPRLTFFGHTHVPSLFSLGPGGIDVQALRGDGSLALEADMRYLLNPGSIGQPRDRDPRAAYMTYDEGAGVVSWWRVAYPIDQAQRRIVEAGLPSILAERLAVGI